MAEIKDLKDSRAAESDDQSTNHVPACAGMTKNTDHDLSFEEAYRQLADLVKKMEAGTLPLAETVAAYEQAMKLKTYCEQMLKAAELKIEQVISNK